MVRESIHKVYAGGRNYGAVQPPVLVVIGDNTREDAVFSEHFMFYSFHSLPFLCGRHYYAKSNLPRTSLRENPSFEEYPELFSASALLLQEFEFARAEFENALYENDASRPFIRCDEPVEFIEADDSWFIGFKRTGRFASEMEKMFAATRSRSLTSLQERIAKARPLKWTEDQM